MKEYLERVLAGDHLPQGDMEAAFDVIMSGEATPVQIAGFLIALRMKGETSEEIAGGAVSMRKHAVQIDVGDLNVVDTCGTGGDNSNTFNISTTAGFITAGAGVPVAKHGNRSVSSKCGSADVLMELGVNLEVTPEIVSACIKEAGIGFMFAPKMHPAMKYAMPVRKDLAVRTMFNMLGPLTNPANAKNQVLGVFTAGLTELFANVLKLMGSERVFVVHGSDGLDEITSTGVSQISELKDGEVTTYEFDPKDLIGKYADPAELKGGDCAKNAEITREVLSGTNCAPKEIACLNAAAAIVVGGKAEDIAAGWALANESVDSGKAEKALSEMVRITNG